MEYFAALLTSVKNKLTNAAVYLNECRQLGIDVAVPDINRSRSDFTPQPAANGAGPGSIVYGLSAVRNVGSGFAAKVIAERDAGGPYASFANFIERVEMETLNKGTLESMIKAGTFDSVGHRRKSLIAVYSDIVDMTVRVRREHDAGVMSLFGEQDQGPTFDDRPRSATPNTPGWRSWRTRRRCSASTSLTTHSRGWRITSAAAPTARWRTCSRFSLARTRSTAPSAA